MLQNSSAGSLCFGRILDKFRTVVLSDPSLGTFLLPRGVKVGRILSDVYVIIMYWLSSNLIVEPDLSDRFFVELTASAFLTFHFRDLNLPEDPFSRVDKTDST